MTLKIAETHDIALCRQLRRVVFIDEQGVSEADELDDQDQVAVHLLALLDGQAIGSARLLTDGPVGKIGRVCVLPSARSKGVGAALIRAAVERFRETPNITAVKLGAQVHALGFYAALGFAPVGDDYLDAGIMHRDMVLTL